MLNIIKPMACVDYPVPCDEYSFMKC